MTIARYYIERLNDTLDNTLSIRAVNPWKWARVRGSDKNGVKLTDISFAGGVDILSLVVRVTSTDTHLAKSRYEIVVGDSGTGDDASLRETGQAPVAGTGITVDLGTGFDKMDRDPPPPPGAWHFDWDFQPAVTIG